MNKSLNLSYYRVILFNNFRQFFHCELTAEVTVKELYPNHYNLNICKNVLLMEKLFIIFQLCAHNVDLNDKNYSIALSLTFLFFFHSTNSDRQKFSRYVIISFSLSG